ncbi:histidinol dehydrogenase-domain-containing protein [Myxozyma melibiosi]|uniref:Histidine biosynthesis trifunctional protein n=1 Tax=Myxozyma melibiosi TaxID=54550 RepID=A0ABR1F0F7_9ASCO
MSVVPEYTAATLQSLPGSRLAVLGAAFVRVASSADVVAVKTFVAENFGAVEFYAILPSGVSVDEAIALLDAGVEAVVVAAADELLAAGVPASRIILSSATASAVESAAGLFVDEAAAKTAKLSDKQTLYVALSAPKLELVKALPASSVVVVPAESLSTELETLAGKLSVADVVVSKLVSDRTDGLFSTLVVDARDTALGLVYSSAESVANAIATSTGVYQSRKRGLWFKGATSGAVQKLLKISADCDSDCLKFVVEQSGAGFCHKETASCFGSVSGISALEKTLVSRKESAPEGSYTKRLFTDEKLLHAKIMEEAEELTTAKSKSEIAWELADLVYFAMTKAVQNGVSWTDVENNLDAKSKKITRRKGDAKGKWAPKEEPKPEEKKVEEEKKEDNGRIALTRYNVADVSAKALDDLLRRPAQKNANIMNLVTPIVEAVRTRGDAALLEFTAKFEKAHLKSPVLKAPFPAELMALDEKTKAAIDMSIENVRKFHAGQLEKEPLVVETQPGVVCSRFARPIETVGLYVPGGTAILPSTALMLGVPAQVAGCKNIIIASPPKADGTLTPEVVYVAHKVGASMILLAGGSQAVAAMAYGTESVPKVNKILGPGNQFVTAAKMLVQNDTSALVSIDMPAGPSEVLVVADKYANPAFVASDLLSQAEHGVDSQVILIAVDLTEAELQKIEDEVHEQAMRLPRVDIVRGAIAHSRTFSVKTVEDAIALSNKYAPEHLILQIEDAAKYVDLVQHAGSVFVGAWSPESCGDYSSGTNHTLPTYGYATVYSGVNTGSFMKHLTSQELTPKGLEIIGPAVVRLADVEGLDAHGNAVRVRLTHLAKTKTEEVLARV